MLSAYEPDDVNGVVSVSVEDRDQLVWKVSVHNLSKQDLTFEMMENVPRGLAIEFWDDEEGLEVHADNLAKFLNLDGFPANLREIKAQEKVTFTLDLRLVSATKEEYLAKWKQQWKSGYFKCRVVFGRYSSRMYEVEIDRKVLEKEEIKLKDYVIPIDEDADTVLRSVQTEQMNLQTFLESQGICFAEGASISLDSEQNVLKMHNSYMASVHTTQLVAYLMLELTKEEVTVEKMVEELTGGDENSECFPIK
ncbi:hypothetical protein [Rubritalea squalenifaciens]|nr:hypothetical protein [Rubritalea squalenifaciens]